MNAHSSENVSTEWIESMAKHITKIKRTELNHHPRKEIHKGQISELRAEIGEQQKKMQQGLSSRWKKGLSRKKRKE